MMRWITLALFPPLLLGCAWSPLAAQDPASSRSGWNSTLGAVWAQGPKYPGSEEQDSLVAPFGTFDYKGIVGLGGSRGVDGFGLYFRPYQTEKLTLGLLAVHADRRKEDDAKALAGMGNRRSCFYLGLEASLKLGFLQTSVEVLKGGRDEAGWTGALEVGSSVPLGERVELGATVTGIWGDEDHQAWEFGISPGQAAERARLIGAGNTYLKARDARAYRPSSGLGQVKTGVSLNWQVTEHWMANASVAYLQLVGDAADSPLTRKKNQTASSVTVLYKF